MTKYFEGISINEYGNLKEAIPLITILIAGADGVIDAKEKEWVTKLSKIRTYQGPEILNHFYHEVEATFEESMNRLLGQLPTDTESRSLIISERLGRINEVLAKLNQTVGATYYASILSLAEHVAKASGGFLRMWSISKEEARWVKLPMIKPIEFPLIDEEIE